MISSPRQPTMPRYSTSKPRGEHEMRTTTSTPSLLSMPRHPQRRAVEDISLSITALGLVAGRGRGYKCELGSQRGDGFANCRFVAEIVINDLPLSIDQYRQRDATDAYALERPAYAGINVVIVGPGIIMASKIFSRVFWIIPVNRDHGEPLVLDIRVNAVESRQPANARAAPGTPNAEQKRLTSVRIERDLSASRAVNETSGAGCPTNVV
jgi:hypothetical protein